MPTASPLLIAVASAVGAVLAVMREDRQGLGRPMDVLMLDVVSVLLFAGGTLFLPIHDRVWRSGVAWFAKELRSVFLLIVGLKWKEGMPLSTRLVPQWVEVDAVWDKISHSLARQLSFFWGPERFF